MDLDGKVALITGAASGIGHAIAKRYLEAGGRVAIADLNEEGAVEAAKELAGQKAAIGVGMDVSKEDQVNEGVARAVEAFDRIDILVSNAGIQIARRKAEVVKDVLLAETVDKQFTTVQDVAEVALFLAAFSSNALTGQSMCVEPRLAYELAQAQRTRRSA